MGNKPSPQLSQLNSQDIEITSIKTEAWLQIEKERLVNELSRREFALEEILNRNNYELREVLHEISLIVYIYRKILAYKTLQHYCKVLKDNSVHIEKSQKSGDLVPTSCLSRAKFRNIFPTLAIKS